MFPKGPSTSYLGTLDLGNSNCSKAFGEVYDYWVLGPLRIRIWGLGLQAFNNNMVRAAWR